MTFTSFGNGLYTCLSTDTKSTTGITNTSVLVERDTGSLYYFSGGAWSLVTVIGGGGTGGGSGEANTATNVGTGTGTIYRNKTSVTLNLKTLKQGSGVTLTNNADDITIDATGAGGGEVNTASNSGTVGTGVWKDKNGVDLRFYKLNSVDTKLSIGLNGTDRIDFTVNEGNLTLANLAGTLANAKISDLAYTKLTSVPSSFTPSTHKSTHLVLAGDTFVKGDVLAASARYLEIATTDPSSDSGRHWINATSQAIEYWDTLSTPGKRELVNLDSTQTLTNKSIVYSQLTSVPSTFAPSVHASSHNAAAGTDVIHVDTIGAGTDISTNNASTTKHGLLKKLSNITTEYMNGTGNWSVPAGGGSSSGSGTGSSGTITLSGGGTTTVVIPHGLGAIPAAANAWAKNNAALGSFWVSALDATNITLTYAVAPAAGTNNLQYYYLALSASLVNGGSGGSSSGTAGGDLTGTYPNPTITSGVVSTTKLADSSVTNAKIVDAAVCTTKMGDDCVTFPKIQNFNDKTLMGRSAGSIGDPQEITVTNGLLLDTSLTTLSFDQLELAQKTFGFVDDFIGDVASGATTGNLEQNVTGTGAAVTPIVVSETGVYGIWDLETGTTATGRCALFAGNNVGTFLLGQGVTSIETKIRIPILSTSSERFKVVFGFAGDCTNVAINDGVYFEYMDSSSSNWRMCTSNDGTRTETNSSTAVPTNTWVKLRIVINAAASSVTYLIDGVVVGTVSTNIPTATGDPVSPILLIIKTVGTTERIITSDYIACQIKLTTAR